MTRRDLLKAAPAGTVASITAGAGGTKEDPNAQLPPAQRYPKPDLGSHWTLFERLSSKCRPDMSFLEDSYDNPAASAEAGRATLLDRRDRPGENSGRGPRTRPSVDADESCGTS